MLEFTCPTCGKRVQGDDAFAGKSVLCPVCNATINIPQPAAASASPATAIATPEHASQAKVTPHAPPSDGSFREGEPPLPPPETLPSLRKEVARIAFRWVEALVVVAIIAVLIALLLPATRNVRGAAARTQSTNNLKNIGLAFHGFHDANKRLPFNGTISAVGNDNESGSWAFQILPYIDQMPLFANPNTTMSVSSYLCPGRGRPAISTSGAWTDYFINPWINYPANGSVNAVDGKRTLKEITDGTSRTRSIRPSRSPRIFSRAAIRPWPATSP
jgi:type II secretory pathway pseudopilin PulG